jgi:cytochrome b
LVSLVLTCASGVAVYGAQELSGPLAGVVSGLREQWGHLLEEVHEVLASLTLVLVFLHLMGVLFASVEHRENLVWAMITGLKKRDTE